VSLITCKLCGRLYDATRGKICSQCLDELDELYPRVREFIRDHSKTNFSVDSLAEDMDVDILRMQSLVDLGYLDRDVPGISGADEEKRKKEELLQQLKGTLNTSARRERQTDEKSARMYGQERYGTGKKK